MPNKINTVTGTCTPQELGTTLVHEHLLIAWSGWEADTAIVKGFKRDEALKFCVDRLQELKGHGVNTFMDPCPSDIGRDVDFRRFTGKVIPLYSAGHDDYANKRQTEVGNTRGERSKSGVGGPSTLGESERGSAVSRRADDRGRAAGVSGRDDAEILSWQCAVCGDAVGVEPGGGGGGVGRTPYRHCLFRGARGLERTQTLGGEESGGSRGSARGGRSARPAGPDVSHDAGVYAADGQGRGGSVASPGDLRGATALAKHHGGGVKPPGLSLAHSPQSQAPEKDPGNRRHFCQSQKKIRRARILPASSG